MSVELVCIASPGRNVEWELDLAPDVVGDRAMLLGIIEAHLSSDTPVPGHYSVSADRGHLGWFTIDAEGTYEWSTTSSLEHLKARVRQATDRDAARAELEDWAGLEQQAAEVQAARDARLAAGDPAELERRLADRDANAPDDDMVGLLESLRRALAQAGGVPPAQVHVGHLPPRTASAAEGNRRLRTLLVWVEATDERWGHGAARALLGPRLVDRLLGFLRVPAHGPEPEGDTARMDSSTLVSRLRSLADFLDGAEFAASWLYVDPTPDGPGEAETRHTVELDGQNGAEVTANLDNLTDTLASVDRITAEAQTSRVVIEVLGSTDDGTRIRGLATYLEPAASKITGWLGISPEALIVRDLTLGGLEYLAELVADPTSPGDTPSTPDPSTPPDGSTPDPSAPTPSPTTGTDPSAPSPDSPSTGDGQPTTSPTDGGTDPAPESGGAAGGLSTGGNSDAPSPVQPEQPADSSAPSAPSVTPSPDPTSTAQDGGSQPTPPATGQQPGTPDGAPYNADGTPTEPTAGSSADVGPDSSATPSAPDPGNPGQVPVQVDETPVPSGSSDPSSSGAASAEANPSDPTGPAATSTADSSGPSSPEGDDRAARIAELRRQLSELEATEPATEAGSSGADAQPVTAEANTDPVPEGGQNLASGQGGGPSGDPAGGGYVTGGGATSGTADGY